MALVGEKGPRPWCGWRTREAAARAPARVGEGKGKGDPWPVGRLILRATRWVGPKLKRNSFQNKN
jgi:hypothetical protein